MTTRTRLLDRLARTSRRAGVRRSRGAGMLEFALILPIFIFMCLFVIDVGHVMLMSATAQDGAFVAARTVAQNGGNDGGGTGNAHSGLAWDSFSDTMNGAPAVTDEQLNKAYFAVTSGNQCASSGWNSYVRVKASMTVPLLTPGMWHLIGAAGNPNGWTITARGMARCEIVS